MVEIKAIEKNGRPPLRGLVEEKLWVGLTGRLALNHVRPMTVLSSAERCVVLQSCPTCSAAQGFCWSVHPLTTTAVWGKWIE